MRLRPGQPNGLAIFRSIGDSFPIPVPETTSAEAFERYVGGKCLVACRGEAWRDIKAWIIALPRNVDMLNHEIYQRTETFRHESHELTDSSHLLHGVLKFQRDLSLLASNLASVGVL